MCAGRRLKKLVGHSKDDAKTLKLESIKTQSEEVDDGLVRNRMIELN